MKVWCFEGIWYDKLTGETLRPEVYLECEDERMAKEKAFEKLMRIYKNMCKAKAAFAGRYNYGGFRLIYVYDEAET